VPPRATLPSVHAPIQEPSRLHLLPVFAHDVQPHFCPLSPPPRVLEQSRERFLSRQLQLAKPVSASITLVTRPQPGAHRIWANPCAQLDYVRDMRLLLKICNTSRHIPPRASHTSRYISRYIRQPDAGYVRAHLANLVHPTQHPAHPAAQPAYPVALNLRCPPPPPLGVRGAASACIRIDQS